MIALKKLKIHKDMSEETAASSTTALAASWPARRSTKSFRGRSHDHAQKAVHPHSSLGGDQALRAGTHSSGGNTRLMLMVARNQSPAFNRTA